MIDAPGVGCVATSLAHETELKQGRGIDARLRLARLIRRQHARLRGQPTLIFAITAEGLVATGLPVKHGAQSDRAVTPASKGRRADTLLYILESHPQRIQHDMHRFRKSLNVG